MQQLDWFSTRQKGPHHTSLCLTALAVGCSLHQIQDIDACIQISRRLRTLLLALILMSLHPLQKPEAGKWATPHGIKTERHKITLQNIFSVKFTVACWWNDHPTPIWNVESILAAKNSSFHQHLTASYLKKLKNLYFYFLLISACSSSNTSTFCVYLPLYD